MQWIKKLWQNKWFKRGGIALLCFYLLKSTLWTILFIALYMGWIHW
jgi:hypothetical protein